ncbi:MAG: hypothetical protein OIN66_16825 [Candidatus Methanoperedens sp.]|nr:hypothetical protein [Candidatus Methanoperedens sp.]
MAIGTNEILLGVIIFVLAYITYTLVKQLRTLEPYQARRIQDIMVTGAILYWLNLFTPRELGGQTLVLTTAGMLIFLYGYGLLLIEKFREGRREARS